MKILEKSSLCKAEGPNNYLNNIYSNLLRHRRRIIPRDPAIFHEAPEVECKEQHCKPLSRAVRPLPHTHIAADSWRSTLDPFPYFIKPVWHIFSQPLPSLRTIRNRKLFPIDSQPL
jgi:hypothetical protein